MGVHGCRLNLPASGQGPVAGSCEHGNKFFGSIKHGNFFDSFSKRTLLVSNSVRGPLIPHRAGGTEARQPEISS